MIVGFCIQSVHYHKRGCYSTSKLLGSAYLILTDEALAMMEISFGERVIELYRIAK